MDSSLLPSAATDRMESTLPNLQECGQIRRDEAVQEWEAWGGGGGRGGKEKKEKCRWDISKVKMQPRALKL